MREIPQRAAGDFTSLRAFYDWATSKLGKSQATIMAYLVYSSSDAPKSFKNKHEFTFAPKSQGGLGRTPQPAVTRAEWAPSVSDVDSLVRFGIVRAVSYPERVKTQASGIRCPAGGLQDRPVAAKSLPSCAVPPW